ncbi:MAG: hypothetical protein L0Y73_03700 [Candidatus Aminicenantes bacterium]|nr:hypothetical protein [Candidatus Aminicenantes bacterium]
MIDYLVFNELSIPFEDRFKADVGIKLFIETCVAASRIGLPHVRLHKSIGNNLSNLELAPGYFLYNWLNTAKDDVLKDRFRDIITSSPLITDNEPIKKEERERADFQISITGGRPRTAEGLGAAYLLDTVAVSFLSHPLWDNHEIKGITHYYIKEDGAGAEDSVTVHHASRSCHIESHKEWLEKKRKKTLNKSIELWERRIEFFPHLILCEHIETQFKKSFGIDSRYFDQIFDRLKKLDTFAKEWTSGGFDVETLKRYGLRVSGESSRTLSRYGNERKFRLPDGRREIFEMHIKTGHLRIHFFPDEQEHQVYVGYIGPHLRIVS